MLPKKRAPAASGEDSEYELSIDAKSRRPRQKRRKKEVEKSGDDISTDFNRSGFHNTRARNNGRLSGDIASARREVLKELRSYAEELQAAKQPKNATETFSQITASAGSTKEKVELFRASRGLFIACERAIASTEKYAGRLKEIQRSYSDEGVLEQWQQDITSLERIVEFGHQYGSHLSECAVAGTRPYTPEINEIDEDGTLVLEIFGKSALKATQGRSWGTQARQHVKGLKMLGRIVEEEVGTHNPPPFGHLAEQAVFIQSEHH